MAAPDGSQPRHYEGHRKRLRSRFAERGREALADYELLELLLFRSIPRRDTKPIAKDLLARFGTLAGVLSAPEGLLCEVPGVKQATAQDLALVRAASQALIQSSLKEGSILSSWADVVRYCRAAMAHDPIESLRVLFLDRKNRLLRDEVLQTGTVDHTPAYPREILKRALELSAGSIILVPNHPSGDPTPSRADIEMTQSIIQAAEALDLSVHDHIIVGQEGHASLRALGLMDPQGG